MMVGAISVCFAIIFFRGKVMKYMCIARPQVGGLGNLRKGLMLLT